MQRILLFTLAVMLFPSCESEKQKGTYDSTAVEWLDKMSETIGNLQSCSFTIEATSNTIQDVSDQVRYRKSQVYLKAPDHMFSYIESSSGRKGFWYNGKTLALFRYDDKTYDTLQVSGNIIQMIDKANKKYGIEFPAADVFYPSFTDDLIEAYDTIVMLADEGLSNETSILALNDDEYVILSLNRENNLPTQLELVNRTDSSIYYKGVFTHWQINPTLDEKLFSFAIPDGALHQNLLQKSN
jgi:hypothetical protein